MHALGRSLASGHTWLHKLLPNQLQRQCRCAAAAAAAVPPQCCAWMSSTATHQQHQSPQLMRLQQQPRGDGGTPPQRPWWHIAGAAGAAAAAAGWAAWSYNDSQNSLNAAFSDPTYLASASPRAQAAVAASCAAPLLHLQHGLNPTPQQLSGLASALEADAAALGPELATGLWGLAMLGAVVPQQQLARLAEVVAEQMPQMPVYEAILSAWAISLLCSSSSSSSSSSGRAVSMSKTSTSIWQQLLQRLQAASYRAAMDEASLLYLLHTAMQQSAAASAAMHASTRPASSSSAVSSSSSSSTSSTTGSEDASTTTSSSSSIAGAAPQPHATLPEVLQQLQPVHAKLKKRLAAAYQEYVPFQPYIEGPLLVVLHIAKTLPRYIAAAGTATAAGAAAAGPSPLSAVFGGLSAADAQAAARMIGDPGSLGKLKRDLFFRWRADELLDRHQQAVNQVAHVLHRRLQLPMQQGSDADVVLPSLQAAVFVVDDSPAGCLPLPTLPTTTTTKQQLQPRASSPATTIILPVDAAPPSPFTPAYWVQAHVGLQQLMRNRYSAPPGGFACRSCQGIAECKLHCLRQRGWAVVVLKQSEVEAALGGFKARLRKSYDYRGLEQVLRSRLQL